MSAVASAVNFDRSHTPARPYEIDESELRDIISRFGELPIAVPQVSYTQISTRLLDRDVLKSLTSQHIAQGDAADWAPRLERRSTRLRPYLGHYLICVFIRLPGIHYTIEVDPRQRRVVHWEWQTG